MDPSREGEDDSDEALNHSYSEAAVRLTLARLLWAYSVSAGIAAMVCCIYLGVKMIFMWKVAMYTKALSSFDLSLLVGSDIGVLAVIVCLVFLVPRMIMTWITALVFEFIFDRKVRHSEFVENGKKLAREISFITIRNALKGGEVAAAVAAVATLVGLTLLRSHVGDWTGTSVFPW